MPGPAAVASQTYYLGLFEQSIMTASVAWGTASVVGIEDAGLLHVRPVDSWYDVVQLIAMALQ